MTVPGPARHTTDRIKSPTIYAISGPKRPSGGTRKRHLFLLALGGFFVGVGGASAQSESGRVLVLGAPVVDPVLAAWLQMSLPDSTAETSAAWLTAHQSGFDFAALAPLRETDQLITEARRRAAELDEPGALRRLAEAERLLASALGVPGSAAFYAEVQLQLGVTAAQMGHTGLAAASFVRAARLDGRRRLLAGEAAPEVVALAARIYDEAISAPEGELRIATDPPGAHVYVDDVERGVTPFTLRAPVGVHALRFAAADRAPYGTLFELAQGRRPEQRFVLTLDARAASVQALASLPQDASSEALRHAAQAVLQAAPELNAVAWLAHDVPHKRRLLFVCERAGCRTPLRAEDGRPAARSAGAGRLSSSTLAAARDWLHAASFSPSGPSVASVTLWQRWYFWSVLGAALLGGGVLVAVAAQPEPQRTLRVTVDPGALR
jgi:hypothetical protein